MSYSEEHRCRTSKALARVYSLTAAARGNNSTRITGGMEPAIAKAVKAVERANRAVRGATIGSQKHLQAVADLEAANDALARLMAGDWMPPGAEKVESGPGIICYRGAVYRTAFADQLPPLADEDLARLEADILANGITVKVLVDDENNVIDGANRLRIAARHGLDVPFEVLRDLTDEAKRVKALALNVNRRQLTREQVRDVIAQQLKENPAQSDRLLGEKVGADKKTVKNVRQGLEATGEIPQLEATKGKDGKVRKREREPRPTSEIPKLATPAVEPDAPAVVLAKRTDPDDLAHLAPLPGPGLFDGEDVHQAAVEHAADVCGVSTRMVEQAMKVQREGVPELTEAVRAGRMTMRKAVQLTATSPEMQRAEARAACQESAIVEADRSEIKAMHIKQATAIAMFVRGMTPTSEKLWPNLAKIRELLSEVSQWLMALAAVEE